MLRRRLRKLKGGLRRVPPVRPLALVLAALLVAGCFGGDDDPRGGLVPYPRVGDVAVYEASGALVEVARWENGVPFAARTAQVRYTLAASPDAYDGARQLHPSVKLATEVSEAGAFDLRSERWISARHQAIVQSFYPLSQDQSIVAFDERGYPWMWGASALVGEELVEGAAFSVELPDNLGLGAAKGFTLTVGPSVRLDGRDVTKVDVAGGGLVGTLYMERGVAWPYMVSFVLNDDALPHLRSDGGVPARLEAKRVSYTPGSEAMSPRDRAATFAIDGSAVRTPWDGEMPPDGDVAALRYPLSEAARDAKLLDAPLRDWLAAAEAPILYRATFQEEPGPVEGSVSAHWLLSWVSQANEYYEVQISRLHAPPLPVGIPRVESSAPADAPANEDHGWFDPANVPEVVVPLSEGIRIVRDTFGATDVQVFLRSFAQPPGHSYFLDGGFEEGGVGRYTVVYNPNTGFIEEATGPVRPRLA